MGHNNGQVEGGRNWKAILVIQPFAFISKKNKYSQSSILMKGNKVAIISCTVILFKNTHLDCQGSYFSSSLDQRHRPLNRIIGLSFLNLEKSISYDPLDK